MSTTKRRISNGLALALTLGMLGTGGCEAAAKFIQTPEGAAIVGGAAGAGVGKALGGDTGEVLAATAIGGLVGYIVQQASADQKAEAEREAERARAQMQDEEIARLRSEQRLMAVQIDDIGSRVIVDADGKPVNDKVYAPKTPSSTPSGGAGGDGSQPPTDGGSGGVAAGTGDQQQAMTEGELDGYNVVFVPRHG